MYIVLTKDLPGVGQTHDLKNVKPGFFRNYLAPHGFAIEATLQLLDKLKTQLAGAKAKEALQHEAAAGQIKKLDGKSISLSARASAKGNLFRAISEKSLMTAIDDQLGVKLDKTALSHEPIKTVGVHVIKVRMGTEAVDLKVKVDAKAEVE